MKVDGVHSYYIPNIKYSSNGFIDENGNVAECSYLSDNTTSVEKIIAEKYDCVGYAVGTGANLDAAEEERNYNIRNRYIYKNW